MRLYSLMHPPANSRAPLLVIREGFSLPAFLCGPFWLLAKGMWMEAALFNLLLLFAACLPPAQAALAAFALFWLLGLEGNGFYRRALLRRGYRETEIIAAADADRALLRAFAQG